MRKPVGLDKLSLKERLFRLNDRSKLSAPFPAKYGSTCPFCEKRVIRGSRVVFIGDVLGHYRCSREILWTLNGQY